MKTIYNCIIPLPGFKAVNMFGILFVRKGRTMSETDLNHEAIHTVQMKEMLYIFFYLWYFTEWIVRLFRRGRAYRNISFEKEAYSNQSWLLYLKERKPYAWIDYL